MIARTFSTIDTPGSRLVALLALVGIISFSPPTWAPDPEPPEEIPGPLSSVRVRSPEMTHLLVENGIIV